jgi:hypothetical protein
MATDDAGVGAMNVPEVPNGSSTSTSNDPHRGATR